MLLVKPLQYLNLNGARKFNVAAHQITNSNRIRTITSQSLSRAVNIQTNNASTPLTFNTLSAVQIRSYYRNYEYHPSRIVRAYRKTRTWFTDHLILGERQFENIYSFTFLLGIAILGIISLSLNLQLSGERGQYDVDKTQQKK